MANPPDLRHYAVGATSSGTFGRVLCSARTHHFVADGPAQNGCPGEAITPPELFLSGVAACGVELIEVIARREDISVGRVDVAIRGTLDKANPLRQDVMVFNEVDIDVAIHGVTREEGNHLLARFKAS